MIESAESALGFVSGRARGDLDDDQMLYFAVVRAIEIVGEAASKVSLATRQATADLVPWPLIISMRNRVAHAYFDIEPDIVWKTVLDELPRLLPTLRALLE
jgi:uncharacterized protein with HEPN domain